jgi:molecular chaperone DnaJ
MAFEMSLEEAVYGKDVEIRLPNSNKKVSVNIPAGVDTGNKIRLSGEGEASQYGGEHGDLFIVVQVQKHDFLEREGNHLYCEVPIRVDQAILGAEIEIPTLSKKVLLKIPPETQTGKIFKLRDLGAGSLRGKTTGDLFVRVVVETPSKLSSKQKTAIESAFSGIEKNFYEADSFTSKINKKFK